MHRWHSLTLSTSRMKYVDYQPVYLLSIWNKRMDNYPRWRYLKLVSSFSSVAAHSILEFNRFQQLYLATGDSPTYDEPMSSNLVNEQQLCVVCHFFPLSRALLPCRHTCICAQCFPKLDCCPMCRSPIKTFFCVRAEDYVSDCSNEKATTTSKLERFSDWVQNSVTNLFGIRR